MSKQINVKGLTENDDPCYRYKMPQLVTTQQKTKTVIMNLKDISKSLDRDPILIINFFKNKFSIPINHKDDKAELKGISQEQLQEGIFEFIECLVLCSTCKNPETIMDKGYLDCKACGKRNKIIVNKLTNKLI